MKEGSKAQEKYCWIHPECFFSSPTLSHLGLHRNFFLSYFGLKLNIPRLINWSSNERKLIRMQIFIFLVVEKWRANSHLLRLLLWEEVRKVQTGYLGLAAGSKACSECSAAPGVLPRKLEGNRTCLLSDQVHWHAPVINAWLLLRLHLLSLSLHTSHVLQGTALSLKELKKFHRWKKRFMIFVGTSTPLWFSVVAAVELLFPALLETLGMNLNDLHFVHIPWGVAFPEPTQM